MQFTIWDLKGSDEFLVIHQAFLTPHAIFLLVWDITKRNDEDMKKLEPHILNIKVFNLAKNKITQTNENCYTEGESKIVNSKCTFRGNASKNKITNNIQQA